MKEKLKRWNAEVGTKVTKVGMKVKAKWSAFWGWFHTLDERFKDWIDKASARIS